MLHQPHLSSCLLALFVLLSSSSSSAAEGNAEPKAAPKPSPAPTLTTVSERDYLQKVVAPHRGRVVLVNFWATWCAPCLDELPELQRAHARFPKGSVDVVLVSADFGSDAPADIHKTLTKLKVPYGSFLQKADDAQNLINLVDPAWQGDLPYTIVYDASGAAVVKLRGAQDEATLTKAIEAALSSKTSSTKAPAKR